ncbi:hypothetical protein TBLA_0B09470 [Henningerozyma blattae CBS 6284]|uniref:dolichyl-phosphate-mannose--protein mannosyltransferase n=1 Tax=Henningerozyma blattae (strain ATCC 34711 / CBS 6284 / DSM 70876 / NBRC 10599 / NRRL Y-10934 / UCD 77-7) TaxID=1071380 RepID=I2H062_HENB6|nr:hypothetical protein TBLA_0B09470 [Tetrapisispora blattae CBS 6284]CCH59764.1 hypothetical protein TBLA_0B09470 [Tetrapisispora blattae CBS 6284]
MSLPPSPPSPRANADTIADVREDALSIEKPLPSLTEKPSHAAGVSSVSKSSEKNGAESFVSTEKSAKFAKDTADRSLAANESLVTPAVLAPGPFRRYLVTTPLLHITLTPLERWAVPILTLVTLIVRCWSLTQPPSVVFDEVHFGKFAAKYVRHVFFFDVHPPLAKLLFAGISWFAGSDGRFEFDAIGTEFPTGVPYVAMRLLSSLMGVGTVLAMYYTLRASGVQVLVALLMSACLAVENAFATISRYILLDSPLVFFIALATLFFTRYQLYEPLSLQGLFNLLLSGLFLGCAASSKWVGFFTVAWVGCLSLIRVWLFLGDLRRSTTSLCRIIASKLSLLLLIPFSIYCISFYIHFQQLTQYDIGATIFSPELRSTLHGNPVPEKVLLDVGLGSEVTLRHVGTDGGYLHSHPEPYPEGSGQQQITLYGHSDPNNKWLIEDPEIPFGRPASFRNLTDGSRIRFLHSMTQRRLHSHDHKCPVSTYSDWQKEVSAYGNPGFNGDPNDDWIVEIDKEHSEPGEAQIRVQAMRTKFRLRHALMSCYLFSHDVKLPEWGHGQQEVTCAYMGKPDLLLWQVEDNERIDDDVAVAQTISYKTPSFWQKFVEVNRVMYSSNNKLTGSHPYQSQPQDWPFLKRGISYWGRPYKQIYFMGNAVVWWSTTFSLVAFIMIALLELIMWQLNYRVLQDPEIINFFIQSFEFALGYALHYVPFFFMGRQLYLHHYLPAYYYGILVLSHMLNILVTYVFRNKKNVAYVILFVYITCTLKFYQTYKPLSSGELWTKSQCEKSRLLQGWDYHCFNYLDSMEDYSSLPSEVFETEIVAPYVSNQFTFNEPDEPLALPEDNYDNTDDADEEDFKRQQQLLQQQFQQQQQQLQQQFQQQQQELQRRYNQRGAQGQYAPPPGVHNPGANAPPPNVAPGSYVKPPNQKQEERKQKMEERKRERVQREYKKFAEKIGTATDAERNKNLNVDEKLKQVDEILERAQGHAKFVDQDGNEIPENMVKQLLQNSGGYIIGSTKRVVGPRQT